MKNSVSIFRAGILGRHRGGYWRGTFTAATLLLAGCASYIDPSVPVPIRPVVEPEFQQRYLLYRPSSYDRNMGWPLVVVCPSGFPDSPDQQIRDWTQMAERQGFLVCAPQLQGNRTGLFADVADTVTAVQDDEKHVLATIRHIQAAYTVSPDRIFIYGWNGGAQTAIHVGLRHPELFRAVAVIQPKVNTVAFADVGQAIDSHQPVLVYSNAADAILGHPSRECSSWLRDAGADLRDDSSGPARRTDTSRVVDFFDHVIRNRPWIRIVPSLPNPSRSSEFHFAAKASFKPSKLRWKFGDGDEAEVAEPIHAFAKPGAYHVTVELTDPQGKAHERSANVNVR